MRSIRLVRVGKPDEGLLPLLVEGLERALQTHVTIDTARIDPAFAHHPEREQIHSTLLLARLDARPDDDVVLGMTEADLYIPILTFVFGEAEVAQRRAIVSYHRLRDEHYGLPANRALLLDRLVKESIHEIGHARGLLHCHDSRCVMAASHAVERIDVKTAAFCATCAAHTPTL